MGARARRSPGEPELALLAASLLSALFEEGLLSDILVTVMEALSKPNCQVSRKSWRCRVLRVSGAEQSSLLGVLRRGQNVIHGCNQPI
jgi:hypothetical protein